MTHEGTKIHHALMKGRATSEPIHLDTLKQRVINAKYEADHHYDYESISSDFFLISSQCPNLILEASTV